ncbi:hypothetical protein LLH23_09805 [bacterium]|nr:hypothetical protein [bacterium]
MTTRRMVFIVVGVLVTFLLVSITGGIFIVRNLGRLTHPLLGVGKTYAGKPIPCGPEAMTGRKMTDYQVGYYRKQLVVAYQQVGKHDSRWDATAEKYLQGLALRYAGHPDMPDDQWEGPVVKALERLQCDDPLVLSRIAQYYRHQHDYRKAEAYARRALPGLKQLQYPATVLAWTYHIMACVKGEVGHSLERADFQWRPLAINAYADAADKKYFGPYEQSALWADLTDIMESDFRRSQAVVVKALKDRPNTDPWLLNMAWGQHCKDYAWVNRGTGWAQDVKPQQWEQFGKYSQLARGYYEKAYAVHPEYPEPASAMICIVNSAGGRGTETERQWFDRCVAAQLDYSGAYYGMLNSLLPRWGGSHEAMLAFGQECLATGRFDTDVPFMYSEAVDYIANRDRDDTVWRQPEVFDGLRQCFEGYIAVSEKSPYPVDRDKVKDFRTRLAVKAYQTGNMDVARQQLDALHGQLDRAAMDRNWGERLELVAGEIYAVTGSNKEKVTQAENLFQTQKTAEALGAFQQLLKQEQEPHARFYLRDRLQTLQWEKQLQANQWVALNPTPDLVGWSPWQGEIRPLPTGNGFVMRPGETYALMICSIRPGRWYEMQCDVEFPPREVQGIEAGFLVDVATATSDPYYDTFRIIRSPTTGYCGSGWGEDQEHALTAVPQELRMRIVQCDDRVTFYMNEQTVFQDRRLTHDDFRLEGPHTVGIGGETYPDPRQPVIYRNIRIHKMK